MSDDFADFDDLLKNMKPGAMVMPLLRYRMGANYTNWALGGNNHYVPKEWQMLAGASLWSGGSATSGALEVVYPFAFTSTPLLIGSVAATTPPLKPLMWQLLSANPDGLEFYWSCPDALTAVVFHWLAIGPIAVG
jgi:hypothetical protein